jgi:hypothetical protein
VILTIRENFEPLKQKTNVVKDCELTVYSSLEKTAIIFLSNKIKIVCFYKIFTVNVKKLNFRLRFMAIKGYF